MGRVFAGSKSGQKFFVTHDGRFFMKTISRAEAKFFRKASPSPATPPPFATPPPLATAPIRKAGRPCKAGQGSQAASLSAPAAAGNVSPLLRRAHETSRAAACVAVHPRQRHPRGCESRGCETASRRRRAAASGGSRGMDATHGLSQQIDCGRARRRCMPSAGCRVPSESRQVPSAECRERGPWRGLQGLLLPQGALVCPKRQGAALDAARTRTRRRGPHRLRAARVACQPGVGGL